MPYIRRARQTCLHDTGPRQGLNVTGEDVPYSRSFSHEPSMFFVPDFERGSSGVLGLDFIMLSPHSHDSEWLETTFFESITKPSNLVKDILR